MNFIKRYIETNFSPEKFEKFFDDLARGKYTVTTNTYLRWCVFFTATTFIFFYFKNILFTYVNFMTTSYGDTLEQEPFMVIPIAFKVYLYNLKLQGMSIKSFEILLQLISLVRFIILAIRFNILTSFVMTTISFLAAYAWYIDMVCRFWNFYINLQTFIPTDYSTLIGKELENYHRAYSPKNRENNFPNIVRSVRKMYTDNFTLHFFEEKDFENWLISHNGKVSDEIDHINFRDMNAREYMNDPISLGVRKVIDTFKGKNRTTTAITATYYLMREKYFNTWSNFFSSQFNQYKSIILYTYIVRKGRKFMPYLIRWHWTLCTIMNALFSIVLSTGVTNLSFYVRNVLRQEYKDAIKDVTVPRPYIEALRFKIEVTQYCTYLVFLICLTFYFLAALHAVCGQYFFVPVFTVNAELNIGERKSRSLYSGGHTSWQDLEDSESTLKIWHGVFGRGTDKVPVILIIFDFIKNLFVRFFKFLKR